jgi:hypothetical protein
MVVLSLTNTVGMRDIVRDVRLVEVDHVARQVGGQGPLGD